MRMLAKHYCYTEKNMLTECFPSKPFFSVTILYDEQLPPHHVSTLNLSLDLPILASFTWLALISLTGRPFERCLRTFGWSGKHQQEICASASVASNVRVAATETSLTNWLWQTMVLRNIICFQKWFHSNCQFRLVVSWRLDSCLAFAGICRA